MSDVRKRELLQVSLRLGLLQSTWCDGVMQSVGLAHCMVPALKRLYPTDSEFKLAVQRYKEPFNTHPFVASIVAGAAIRLEAERHPEAVIGTFIRSTMGPLAALGDPFFRGALVPLTAVVASFAAIVGGPIAGILTLLLVFNTVHFAVRFGGVLIGFHEGTEVLSRAARWLSPTRTSVLKKLAAAGAGVILTWEVATFGDVSHLWTIVAVGLSGLLAAIFLRFWQSSWAFIVLVLLVAGLALEVLL